MNRIIKEHYPVEKLPADLREGLGNSVSVRLVIEADAAVDKSGDAAYQRLLADMATWKLDGSGDDSAERVRRLRDEWDD